MLLEAVDDSVVLWTLILLSLVLFLMMYAVQQSYAGAGRWQRQPIVHNDSVNDVNRYRHANNIGQQQQQRQHQPSNEDKCPICLGDILFPIETNCGHIFCSRCAVGYWQSLSDDIYFRSMKCAMCRQDVNCLIPMYNRREELDAQTQQPEMAPIFQKVKEYNRRFGNEPRPYMDYINELPLFIRHVLNQLFSFSFEHLTIYDRLRIGVLLLLAFCYLISPLDLVPEALFGILGLFDDLLILFTVGITVAMIYRDIIINRQ